MTLANEPVAGLVGEETALPAETAVTTGSVRSRALRASMWVIAGKPLDLVLQTARSLILTRLLFPEAFGLMALVSVVLQGLQMCSDVGISTSIVNNRRGNDPDFLQTAWTLQIIRGFFLWLLCCAAAWPAAAFYHERALLSLIPVSGLNVLILGFSSTAWATSDRDMLRGRVTIVAYVSSILNLGVIVALAWVLRSVWALVIATLIGNVTSVILGHLFLPGSRHRLRWNKAAAHELVHFGKWVFISTLLTFLAMQLDRLLLAKLIPMAIFGVYSISLTLAGMPKEVALQIASFVLFPALAERFRNSPKDMQQSLARSRGVLLRVGLLLCLGVAAAAPAFFHLLYDARYAAAGWIAQLLAVSCWVTLLNTSTGYALLAFGDSKSVALGNLANAIITVIAAAGGFYLFALPGFIIGFAVGTAAGELVQMVRIRRHGVAVFGQNMRFTAIATIVGAAYLLITWSFRLGNDRWGSLLQTGVGSLLWLVVAAALLPPVIRDLAPKLRLPWISGRSTSVATA